MDKDIGNAKLTSLNIINTPLCSNKNRAGIVHLLKKTPDNELQAERIAQKLGITHRTALYHLDILEQNGLVEVRGFRKKGDKLMRSVWGLTDKEDLIKNFFLKMNGNFDINELDEMIKRNVARR